MKHIFTFNNFVQFGLISLTISGFLLTSIKLPEYGLILNLLAQFFWIISSWKAAKEANQWGILITTLFITSIIVYGVINYWFL